MGAYASKSCSFKRRKARPLRRASFTNKAMSFAIGRGRGRLSPDFTRKAVIRYDASCDVVHTRGFEGRSSTLTGEGKGGAGALGSVSDLRDLKGGNNKSSDALPRSRLVCFFGGDSRAGGIGRGLGSAVARPTSDLLYRCFCIVLRLGVVGIYACTNCAACPDDELERVKTAVDVVLIAYG